MGAVLDLKIHSGRPELQFILSDLPDISVILKRFCQEDKVIVSVNICQPLKP